MKAYLLASFNSISVMEFMGFCSGLRISIDIINLDIIIVMSSHDLSSHDQSKLISLLPYTFTRKCLYKINAKLSLENPI